MSTEKSSFSMDPDWLAFDPSPSKPRFAPPPGAIDAHCHVFGPGDRFPYAPSRRYTPCDAPKEKLWALREHLGFARNVIVQATCHGNDNRALTDALLHSNGMARGVASVDKDVSEEALQALDAAGVRGVRFNFVRRLSNWQQPESLMEIVARLAPRGWHAEIYFEADQLSELYDFIAGLPVPVVIDHMGRPDVSHPPDGEAFGLFRRLMQDNNHVWVKVSCPERLSRSGPPAYADVIPFSRSLVEQFPQRVLWGTDWPHPNMKSHMPDDGRLVDLIPRIAVTENLRQQLLVDNPMRLYWPEEVKHGS